MTRAFLVAAMALSLWPAWLILSLGDDSGRSPAEQERSLLQPAHASPAHPELEEIAADARDLNDDLGEADLYRGEPQYDFTFRAESIEEQLLRWRDESRAEATRYEKRVGRRLIRLMQAAVELTEFPSRNTARSYNRALRRSENVLRL